MKKILLLLLLLLPIHTFADYTPSELKIVIKYNNALDKIEKNIYLKDKEIYKTCNDQKGLYKKINDRILKIKKIKPRYSKIFDILLHINDDRLGAVKNRCRFIKKPQLDNNTTINTNNNIETPVTQRNKILYTRIKPNNNVVQENNMTKPNIGKIDEIYQNEFIKVNNKWLWLKKHTIIKSRSTNLDFIIDLIKRKYNKNYIYYKKQDNGGYMFYASDKEDIKDITPFNPVKSIEYNLEQFNKIGIDYIKNIVYINDDNRIYFERNNHLYLIVHGKISGFCYGYEIKDKYFADFLSAAYGALNDKKNKKKYVNINRKTNEVCVYVGNNFKTYDLGEYGLYKKMDIKKLDNILDRTLYIKKYELNNLTQTDFDYLLNFVKQFKGKSLKEIYKWVITNLTYDKQINQLIKKYSNWDDFNKKIKTVEIHKKWSILNTLKHRDQAMCATISEIFSLIALFNGYNANIYNGTYKKDGGLHQISVIDERYYDPTFDLNKKNYKHFNMSRQQMLEYIKPDNNY